jgi:hypothetical protein
MGRWPLGSGGAPLSWTPGDIWALARCGSWRSSRRSVVGGVVGVVRGLLWRARLVVTMPRTPRFRGWRDGGSAYLWWWRGRRPRPSLAVLWRTWRTSGGLQPWQFRRALGLDVRVGGLRHDGGLWAWAQDWGVSWWPLHPCFGSWRALAFHWTVGGCALSGGLDSSGLVPFSLGSLGGHPGRGCGRAGVGHRASGDPPPHASGWVLVQLVFQSVGSFLAGGDDWGGLSFPYWVFLPPA